MPTTNDHPAVATLQAFFAEMNAYETECARDYKTIDWENTNADELAVAQASQREWLERIFERYCEIGTQAERLGDLGSIPLDQPEHSDESVTSVSEKAGKVIIETRQARFRGWEFRYELVEVNGQWRVRDNRKFRSQGKPKWKEYML